MSTVLLSGHESHRFFFIIELKYSYTELPHSLMKIIGMVNFQFCKTAWKIV